MAKTEIADMNRQEAPADPTHRQNSQFVCACACLRWRGAAPAFVRAACQALSRKTSSAEWHSSWWVLEVPPR